MTGYSFNTEEKSNADNDFRWISQTFLPLTIGLKNMR
jgi:hypothetical protein